jgi:hypothetical protein
VTVTLNLKPEIEAGLLAQADAAGMSPEAFLQQLVEKELAAGAGEPAPSEGSGMVWENGLFVYRTGMPLPAHVLDNAIGRSCEERTRRVLGDLP